MVGEVIEICGVCEQQHTRCNGHRRDGQPCGLNPVEFLGVCRVHGGNTQHAKKKRKELKQEEVAKRAVKTFGIPKEIDPHEALLEEVHRTAGHVDWLAQIIGDLPADTEQTEEMNQSSIVWGITQHVYRGSEEFPGTDVFREAKPSVWIDLYQREREHLVKVCKAALDAGIDERRVQIAEQQGAIVARAMTGLLDVLYNRLAELGVEDDHLDTIFYQEAPRIARQQLALAGGTEDEDS